MTTSSKGLNEFVSEMFCPMLMGAGCVALYQGFTQAHSYGYRLSAVVGCIAAVAFWACSKNHSNDSRFAMAQKTCFCVLGASGTFLGGGIGSRNRVHIALSALVGIVTFVSAFFLKTKKRKLDEVS